LGNLNLNGDAEEEYDMVDDSDDPAPNAAGTRNGRSKVKYMNELQEVANRERDGIVIDLNDVEAVSWRCDRVWRGTQLIGSSTRNLPQTASTITS
jgi:DNA replication licensing factor MCM7